MSKKNSSKNKGGKNKPDATDAPPSSESTPVETSGEAPTVTPPAADEPTESTPEETSDGAATVDDGTDAPPSSESTPEGGDQAGGEPSGDESEDVPGDLGGEPPPDPDDPAAVFAFVERETAGMSIKEIIKEAREGLGLRLNPQHDRAALLREIATHLRKQAELERVGPDGRSGEVWDVSSRPPKFRRAGLAFGREPRTLDPAKLTDEQRKLIDRDPHLIVRKRQAGEE